MKILITALTATLLIGTASCSKRTDTALTTEPLPSLHSQKPLDMSFSDTIGWRQIVGDISEDKETGISAVTFSLTSKPDDTNALRIAYFASRDLAEKRLDIMNTGRTNEQLVRIVRRTIPAQNGATTGPVYYVTLAEIKLNTTLQKGNATTTAVSLPVAAPFSSPTLTLSSDAPSSIATNTPVADISPISKTETTASTKQEVAPEISGSLASLSSSVAFLKASVNTLSEKVTALTESKAEPQTVPASSSSGEPLIAGDKIELSRSPDAIQLAPQERAPSEPAAPANQAVPAPAETMPIPQPKPAEPMLEAAPHLYSPHRTTMATVRMENGIWVNPAQLPPPITVHTVCYSVKLTDYTVQHGSWLGIYEDRRGTKIYYVPHEAIPKGVAIDKNALHINALTGAGNAVAFEVTLTKPANPRTLTFIPVDEDALKFGVAFLREETKNGWTHPPMTLAMHPQLQGQFSGIAETPNAPREKVKTATLLSPRAESMKTTPMRKG